MFLYLQNAPSLTYDIFPLCSEITSTTASVFSLIPIAALWRSPNLEGIEVDSETGSTTRVDLIKLLSTIMAPSCKGLFLKNMVSSICALISIFASSPVLFKKSRLFSL